MLLRLPIDHVIFDLDGVLLDTEPLYTAATQTVVARYGKTFDWSIKSNMVGRPALDSARYLVAALALPLSAEEYLREREKRLIDLFAGAEPCPGAREITRALAARGVAQSVATSSERAHFDIKTRRHAEWFRVFSNVVVGDDPRLHRGKPAPDIFLLAADDARVPPARCVVVEDSPAGIAAARAAGMQAVAVPDPHMDRGRFADADLVVASLLELEAVLIAST
jgi:pseudouridine-5'-monophosphatase